MRYNGDIKKSMEKLKERASMALNLDRRSAGQWMTDGDPFYMPVFAEWLDGAYIRKSGRHAYRHASRMPASLGSSPISAPEDSTTEESTGRHTISPRRTSSSPTVSKSGRRTPFARYRPPRTISSSRIRRTSPATRQGAAVCRSHSTREGGESRSRRIYTNLLSTHASNRPLTA